MNASAAGDSRTDGMQAAVDAHDARRAVEKLDQQGIFPYCISLDPKADEYVGDIFGRQFTVIDHIKRLPQLFHGAHQTSRLGQVVLARIRRQNAWRAGQAE